MLFLFYFIFSDKFESDDVHETDWNYFTIKLVSYFCIFTNKFMRSLDEYLIYESSLIMFNNHYIAELCSESWLF